MRKTFYIALALFAFGACSKTSEVVSDNEIHFHFSLPGSTKVAGTSFQSGDAVSLYAVEYSGTVQMPLQIGGNWFNNERLTYNGSAWSGAQTLYWSEKACDFYAFYPYQSAIGSMEKYPFSLSLNQNTTREGDVPGGYEASDLLYASATNVSKGSSGSVDLSFRHLMSKLVVRVLEGPNFEGIIPDDIVAHVYNTVTECYVDWTKGSVEKDGFGSKSTITMKKINNTLFEAVLIPQNIERRTPLIELTMGGIAYLLEYSLSFRPGYVHYVDLTLNTSPDQEQIEISIDPGQGNWN